MQKRVLPSAEVSLASKVFEKFFAAHEFEDILTHHKDLCDILQIKAGLLSECYPVIKVSLKSRKMFSMSWTYTFDVKESNVSRTYISHVLELVLRNMY